MFRRPAALLLLLTSTFFSTPALAETCEDRGSDYALRITLCDQAFEAAQDPEAAAFALAMKGEAQRMLGDYAGAAETLQHALRLTPANAWVWVELGNVRYDEGDVAGALAHYSGALAVEDYADAWANRAEAWWDFRMDDNCVSDAGEALRIDPQFAYANEIMGRCLIELGRAEDALSYFDTAISLAPDYQNAYRNKMAALTALGRYEEAVSVADQALTPGRIPFPNPAIEEDILSRRLLALAKYATPAELAKASEELLQRYPESFAAMNIKARALLAEGKGAEADTLTAKLRQNPDGLPLQAIYMDTLAQIDMALGRLEDAYANYSTALEIDPSFAKVYARQLSGLGFLPLSNAPEGVMTALGRCLDVKKAACVLTAE